MEENSWKGLVLSRVVGEDLSKEMIFDLIHKW